MVEPGSSRSLDIAKLDRLDTPGALFLCGLVDKGVELTGVRTEHRALLDLIRGLDLKPMPKVDPFPGGARSSSSSARARTMPGTRRRTSSPSSAVRRAGP